MKANVIYGSDNGNTRNAANLIAEKIGGTAIDIATAGRSDFEGCDLLVLGVPTYGFGDLQCEWESRLELLTGANLSGKKVALFGLGDQSSYADSFVDAMGQLYEIVMEKGVTLLGRTQLSGYEFNESRAVQDGMFVGLVLDEDNQPAETEPRIAAWVEQLSKE